MRHIKFLREKIKLTQAALADKISVEQSAVSQWESGAAQPTAENLKKLATVLGCSVDEILGLTQKAKT